MRRAPLAGLALLLSLGTPAAAETPATTQWVLATAKATGRNGEDYVSSLRITNPTSQTANVDLTYLAQSPFDGTFAATGDNTAAPTVRVTVDPGETLPIEDVIGTKFGANRAPFGISAGGIRVDSDVPVSVLSRTFVANAKSASGVPGTFGFTIPAQVVSHAVSAGESGWLSYAASSPSSSSGFRTNLILLNTGARTTVATVSLLRGDGTPAAPARDYTLAPAGAAQQTDVGTSFDVAATETNLRLVVTVKSGGPLAFGASLIDNAISSVAYLPPAKIDAPDDAAYGWVVTRGDPALASAGRLDLQDGAPNFLSGVLAVDCSAGSFLYTLLAYGAGSGVTPNTTFTPAAAGGWSFAGSAADSGSWSGTISPWVDGSLFGTLTYTTAASARCASETTTFDFVAARAFGFGTTP